MRRGRAAKATTDEYEIDSDVDDGELASWVEKPGRTVALDFMSKGDEKMTKYLAPGNIMSLYQHYASSRQLLGSNHVSSDPKLFS